MADTAKLMARYGDLPGLGQMLGRHPRLLPPQPGSLCALEFGLGGYRRSVVVGFRKGCSPGVIELFDNNPIVCAETVCVPTPLATLALLAVDPLSKAGLVAGSTPIACSSSCLAEEIEPFLEALGDRVSVVCSSGLPVDEGRLAVELRLSISLRSGELREIYDEAYGRSMLVMRAGAIHPLAASYTVTQHEHGPIVRFESPVDGKAGAAQVVQALNVMAGFEDSLGIG